MFQMSLCIQQYFAVPQNQTPTFQSLLFLHNPSICSKNCCSQELFLLSLLFSIDLVSFRTNPCIFVRFLQEACLIFSAHQSAFLSVPGLSQASFLPCIHQSSQLAQMFFQSTFHSCHTGLFLITRLGM